MTIIGTLKQRTTRFTKNLWKNTSGVVAIEFALVMPVFLVFTMGILEIARYSVVVMQINQVALHVADSAGRMGTGTLLATKRVSELNINDVFAGAIYEGRQLDLNGSHEVFNPGTGSTTVFGKTRIILSSVEPQTRPLNPSNRFRIVWQRCAGTGTHYVSNYGTPTTATDIPDIGRSAAKVTPPPDGALMFVEVQHHYEPLIDNGFAFIPTSELSVTKAMPVRDTRDWSQIYNNEAVTPSTCNF